MMSCEACGFAVLDEPELIEFFCVEPIERIGGDGYFCFEVSDDSQNKLRFSYNIFERSVQTVLLGKDNRPMVKTSYEGNVRMSVRRGILLCEFCDRSTKTTLTISLKDGIEVDWTTLRTEDEYGVCCANLPTEGPTE